MIFITKIELENFQSHKYTIIEFNRGLNVIVGNSDSGKTAILRAIRWALYNEPSGDYFIRQGEKNVSVTIYFNTNAIVRRFRTPSKNSYYLKKADGEELNFDGFGVHVPKEIIEEIKMDKINLDKNENSIINISSQLEGPFLLNEKNSVRASAIGRLVGVNYVDDALRNTIRDSKNLLSEIRNISYEKELLKEKISKYNYIEEKEKVLRDLNKKFKLIVEYKEKLSKIILLNKKYLENINNIESLEEEIKNYVNIEALANKLNLLDLKYIKYKNYLALRNKYEKINIQVKENVNIVHRYKNIKNQETIILDLNRLILQTKNLSLLNKKYKYTYRDFKEVKEFLNRLIYLSKLEENILKLDKISNKYNRLFILNEKNNEIEKRIETGNFYLTKFENLQRLEKLYNILVIKLNKIKNMYNIIINYKNIIDEEYKLKIERENLEKIILELSDYYEKLFLEIGICPLCFNEINENNIEHIKMHFKEKI